MTTTATHRIEHYVYEVASDRSTLRRRKRQMRGSWPSEARCTTCGVETRTGGATERHIRQLVEDHKVGLPTGGWYPTNSQD